MMYLLDLYDILMKMCNKIYFFVNSYICVNNKWGDCIFFCHWIEIVKCFIKIDEDEWIYDSMMSEEVDMDVQTEEDVDVKVEHVDFSYYVFNTSQVFVYWCQTLFELCYSSLLVVMKFYNGLDCWLMTLDLLSL